MTVLSIARLACVLSAMVCLPARLAHADALEDAKRIAKQANIHYQIGHFSESADAYAKSYELVPSPGLLFNLGQCQMMLKSYSRAIFFFEGYLRDKPDAPNAALARDLIEEARRELAAQRGKDEAEAARVAAVARTILPAAPPPPPPSPPRDRRRVIAVALGASSIPLIGAALYLGVRAESTDDHARLAAAGSPERAAFDSDHRRAVIAAALTGGLGAAGAITSGVLGYLGWRRARMPSVSIAPTARGAAASLFGTF